MRLNKLCAEVFVLCLCCRMLLTMMLMMMGASQPTDHDLLTDMFLLCINVRHHLLLLSANGFLLVLANTFQVRDIFAACVRMEICMLLVHMFESHLRKHFAGSSVSISVYLSFSLCVLR